MIGYQSYMPPEFYTGKYNQSLDVFTFGLTLYFIFTENQHLFNLLLRRICLPLESPIFNELIVCCIDNVPNRRPSYRYQISFYFTNFNYYHK
jgi:serine/threonine protein kinase